MSRRRGWSKQVKRDAAERVLRGELPELVARDVGVRLETLMRWTASRQQGNERLAALEHEIAEGQAKGRTLAELCAKGEVLLDLNPTAFDGLVAMVDAAILRWQALSDLEKCLEGSGVRLTSATAAEVN